MTVKTITIVPVEFDEKTKLAIFTDTVKFEDFFRLVEEAAKLAGNDISTKEGREKIRSTAAKIARTKTVIDEMGKHVKDEAQKTVDSVNQSRRLFSDKFDALKNSIRNPLTEYENIEKEKDQRIEDALQRLREIRVVSLTTNLIHIENRFAELETIRGINDWRGKQDIAAELIEAAQKALADGKAEILERQRLKEENERLERERAAEAMKKAEAENKLREQLELEQAEKDRVIAEKQAEKDREIAEKQAEIAEREAENAELRRKLEESEKASKMAAESVEQNKDEKPEQTNETVSEQPQEDIEAEKTDQLALEPKEKETDFSFDPRCQDLAFHFLGEANKHLQDDLAQRIQNSVEEFLNFHGIE